MHAYRPRLPHTIALIPLLLALPALAQTAPSVCNRQSCKAYVYTGQADKDRILALQDGNGGFGSTAGAIIVCTSDLSAFYKPGERNQGFVDGGLFAMSLVYALHALGAASCMLNWSHVAHRDRKLRTLIGLPEREIIISLVAVGSLPERFDVAASPRRELDDVLRLNMPLVG